jgi:hypothetical protein
VSWVRERTISTERPPLVDEVSANFWGKKVPRGQRDGSLRPYSLLSRPEPLLFLSGSSSVVLTRLSGPRSKPNTYQKMWQTRESNPDLWICSQELWPLDHRGGPTIDIDISIRAVSLSALRTGRTLFTRNIFLLLAEVPSGLSRTTWRKTPKLSSFAVLSFNGKGGGSTILQAEGRGFDSRYSHWIFNCPNISSRPMAQGLTQPLT